jgi:hypothetical protein
VQALLAATGPNRRAAARAEHYPWQATAASLLTVHATACAAAGRTWRPDSAARHGTLVWSESDWMMTG